MANHAAVATTPLGNSREFVAKNKGSQERFEAQPCGFAPLKKRAEILASENVVQAYEQELAPAELEAVWTRRWIRERMLATLRRLIFAHALPMHAVRTCRVRAIPANCNGRDTGFSGCIELRHEGDEVGRHRYHGQICCGNLLICPVCAAEFGWLVRETVREAARRLLQAGYYCFMLTLTARHTRQDELEVLSDGFQESRRWLVRHRTWKNLKEELGIIGQFAALEVTDDAPETPADVMTGYHWHVHYLVFYRPPNDFRGWFSEQYARSVERRIRRLWQRSLRQHGLDCTLEHGARLTLPRRKGIQMLQDAGVGFEGCDPASVEAAVEYVSKGLTWEITGSCNATKVGRKSQRISMWEMLYRISQGDMSLVPRYAEYMEAVRGRSFLSWSHGLKAFCGLPEDEKKLVESADREAGDTVDYSWSDNTFRSVARYAQATAVRRIADEAGENAQQAVHEAMREIRKGISPRTGELLEDIG